MEKQCTKCGSLKPMDSFSNDRTKPDGKRPDCKSCKAQVDKLYKEKNKETLHEKQQQYYKENSQTIKNRARIWYSENTDRHKDRMKEYYQKNYDAIYRKKREYLKLHEQKFREYMNTYIKDRYQTNVNYRLKSIASARVRSCIKKKHSCEDLIGCDIDFFRFWLEYQFTDDMNWDNIGSYWHIDHVKPISSYNLYNEDELIECFHWSNQRPLYCKENLSKGALVNDDIIRKHKDIVQMFKMSIGVPML